MRQHLIMYVSVMFMIYTLLKYRNSNTKPFIIFSILMYLSGTLNSVNSRFVGVVIAIDDHQYEVLGITHRVRITTDVELELDEVIVLEGDYKVISGSYKNLKQVYYYPKVSKKVSLPSFRRYLWKRLGKRHDVRNTIFLKNDEESSLIASQAWYFVGFIMVFGWMFKPILGNANVTKISKIIATFYFLFITQSIAMFRVFLKSFLDVESQIIIMIIIFPNMPYSPFFWMVYGQWLVRNFHSNLFKSRLELRFIIFLRCLNSINLFDLFFIKYLKYFAGFKYLLTVMALFIPFVPYKLTSVENYILWIQSHTLEIVGTFPLWICIAIIMSSIMSRRKGIILMIVSYSIMYFNPIESVSFINVGQGDATLIRKPFRGQTVLIDTGKPSASYRLLNFFNKKGITSLDTLIITHDDLDHSGNKDVVIENLSVKQLIETKDFQIPSFKSLLEHRIFENKNDNSLIIKTESDILITGDASHLQEWLLTKEMDSKSKILKLGHHGSKTSSSLTFLKHVQPKLAIISSDPSAYGHPHQEVLRRLYDVRVPYLSTSTHGTITLYYLGPYTFIVTESGLLKVIR